MDMGEGYKDFGTERTLRFAGFAVLHDSRGNCYGNYGEFLLYVCLVHPSVSLWAKRRRLTDNSPENGLCPRRKPTSGFSEV
jgi:hypothetical protein